MFPTNHKIRFVLEVSSVNPDAKQSKSVHCLYGPTIGREKKINA